MTHRDVGNTDNAWSNYQWEPPVAKSRITVIRKHPSRDQIYSQKVVSMVIVQYENRVKTFNAIFWSRSIDTEYSLTWIISLTANTY